VLFLNTKKKIVCPEFPAHCLFFGTNADRARTRRWIRELRQPWFTFWFDIRGSLGESHRGGFTGKWDL